LLSLGSGSLMCQSQIAEAASKADGKVLSLANRRMQSGIADTLISFDIPRLPFQLKSIDQPSSLMFEDFDYLDIYHQSLGVFCKAENLLSAKAPVQFRMRLGSLEYVDGLEGK